MSLILGWKLREESAHIVMYNGFQNVLTQLLDFYFQLLMLIYVVSRDYSIVCCSGLARGCDGDLEELEGNIRVTHIRQ